MNAPLKKVISEPTNDGEDAVLHTAPYSVRVVIEGAADLIMHRWSNEDVEAKATAAKNSKTKKTDNVESYVYRDDKGNICVPGEYLRMAIVNAAKFRQDPRSPRKSAMDLFKAGIIVTTQLAPIGSKSWDYLDKRRVVVQRGGITRTRPAFNAGWKLTFDIMVLVPEYIDRAALRETIDVAGRLVGLGDFRPTYGRFGIVRFD